MHLIIKSIAFVVRFIVDKIKDPVFRRFVIVGVSSFFISGFAYSGLVLLGFHYHTATILVFIFYLLGNFWANKRFTFKNDAPGRAQRILHFGLHCTNTAIRTVFLYVMIDVWGFDEHSPSWGYTILAALPVWYISHRWIYIDNPPRIRDIVLVMICIPLRVLHDIKTTLRD